jgi:hypothetical protein
MKTTTVIFDESLHHICLMYGLKQTFARMPFLNKKVLEIRGRVHIMDNPVPPPPMISNPTRRQRGRAIRSIVKVSYWRERLYVEYRDELCSQEDITAFVENLIVDYLHFRHPFMKAEIRDGQCKETSSDHLIAEIQ